MARRPKRTYNQATGKWEVEKLWDHRDDDGFYWKDGVQVDSSGVPIYDAQGNEQGAETPGSAEATSTPGTGVGGGPLPEVGDETIDKYDPRNLITTDEGEIRPHPSKAEEDYYAALDAGEEPKITQEHLNEIAPGAGQMYVSDFYNKSGKGKGQQAAEGGIAKSGSLRRSVRKLSPSLITAKA